MRLDKVRIYEGPLPDAVARDFKFYKVYTAKVKGVSEETRWFGETPIKVAEKFAVEDAKSKSLYNSTLDEAVAQLVRIAELDEESAAHLLADLSVIRNIPSTRTFTDKVRPYKSGILELTVQAIGYKRR